MAEKKAKKPAEEKPEMVEVVVKTRFKDKTEGKRLRRVGETLRVTKARYEEIVATGKDDGVTYVVVKPVEAE